MVSKMAEYDYDGWNAEPYLGEGSMVFGNFDVQITLNKKFVVAASGYLQNANEIGTDTQKKGVNLKIKNFPGIFTHLMFMILHGQLILNIFMILSLDQIMLIFIFSTLITLNIIINGKNCSLKLQS